MSMSEASRTQSNESTSTPSTTRRYIVIFKRDSMPSTWPEPSPKSYSNEIEETGDSTEVHDFANQSVTANRSTDQSQTPSGSTTSNASRKSSRSVDAANDSVLTADTSFLPSPSSPIDTSEFEVPTPPTTPTPSSGRRKRSQRFTSRAKSIAQEVKIYRTDDMDWSLSGSEASPIFNDHPIPCQLPTTRGRYHKISEAEAFDELDKVFRDVVVSEETTKGSTRDSVLDAADMARLDHLYLSDFGVGNELKGACEESSPEELIRLFD